MSIYTYNTNKALCSLLGTEYFEHPSVSDQEIDVIPKDVKFQGSPWNKGLKATEEERARLKKICENRVPWNKGKTGLQKHSDEWKANHSMKMKGKVRIKEHNEKIGAAQRGKPRTYVKRNTDGTFMEKVGK